MLKPDWRRMMEEEILKHSTDNKKPRLLLHVCCAPCSSGVLEMLCRHFSVTCYYDNPNISPKEEYDKRYLELTRLIKEMPLDEVPSCMAEDYDPTRFYQMSQGLENEPEGGKRCFLCYEMRLRDTARKAKAGQYDYFTTTLSVSPYKNAAKLNEIGGRLSQEFGVPYLFSDFKKGDGYLKSIRNSKTYGLYRQNWCGCEFSRRQSELKEAMKHEKEKDS